MTASIPARSAALLALLVAVLAPACARGDTPEDPFAPAPADSAAAAIGLPSDPEAGGDIRVVGVSGAQAVVLVPGVRRVGSGWLGHHWSPARGVLPAAMTGVRLRGRPSSDWLDGGIDLIGLTHAGGRLVASSGPDLSLAPALTAGWPVVDLGGVETLTVDLMPLRRPVHPPFARFSAASGPDGRSLLGAEFGRGFTGNAAVTGYFETDDGRAPAAGGSYGIDRTGGALLLDLRGGPDIELGGVRMALDRSQPDPGEGGAATEREYVRSDLFVRGSTGSVTLELFHTQSWLKSKATGRSANSEVDGASASIRRVGPVDAVRLQLERREVGGSLVHEPQEAVGVRAEASDTLVVGAFPVSLTAGVSTLDGDVVPLARAAVSGGGNGPASWFVAASLTGRHPTALERAAVLVSVSDWGCDEEFISGSPLVEPERAAVLCAAYSRSDVLAGAGARVEAVRVIDPIVLDGLTGLYATPANAADQNGGAATVWAAVGDTVGLSGTADATVLLFDADGPLNDLAPVPAAAARVGASMPLSLFEGYVRARIGAAVEFDTGLARGPWAGLLDDSRAALSLNVGAAVGSARLFASVDDLLETDTARVPGMEPSGRTLSAGFSWRFRD
jgi:hypothetical protein